MSSRFRGKRLVLAPVTEFTIEIEVVASREVNIVAKFIFK
jgi:hypothetical protein